MDNVEKDATGSPYLQRNNACRSYQNMARAPLPDMWKNPAGNFEELLMTDLHTHSTTHIRECYEFYQQHCHISTGSLCKISDHEGRLYAIGKCVGVYWNERHFDWIIVCEIMEEIGLCVGEFLGAQCTRHVGFNVGVVK